MLIHETPIGQLTLTASDSGLTRATVRPVRRPIDTPTRQARRWLDQACDELDGYFAGQLREFNTAVDLSNVVEAQRRILAELGNIGYGETITYGALARRLGLAGGYEGARHVGAAMARNPVWIILPCHRVIGANGKLTGYAGGLAAKRQLLELESGDRAALALF